MNKFLDIKHLYLIFFLSTVVSENWGSQCIRLKVTVKSDNCGESQDCSGKGVCYTNVSMVRYNVSRHISRMLNGYSFITTIGRFIPLRVVCRKVTSVSVA